MATLRAVGRVLWGTVTDFFGDGCPRMAAAISYYSIFAIPGVLGLLALAAREFVGPREIQEAVSEQVQTFVGVESATQVVDVVQGAVDPSLTGPAALIGLIALVFGATGAFGELQSALNIAWGVQRDPRRSDVKGFFLKRAISLVMIAALGVLLLLSIVASTAISVMRSFFMEALPPTLQSVGLPIADLAVSLVAVSALVTIVLRYVPDAVVSWRDAAVGGSFTGALFTVGKLLIGYYLGRSDPGNVFGAAGSLAVALLWVYYSSIILLVGAEFTEVWACRNGDPVVPRDGAVRVRKQVVYAEGKEEGREVEATA
ncbi:MAG: YihY/virulence factor BrkB family protein [Gemmatimonadales bacterium]